tara:strand:+ start:54 stop:395 length:342 start_codon:yes stop_codon:yes gene_type:complete
MFKILFAITLIIIVVNTIGSEDVSKTVKKEVTTKRAKETGKSIFKIVNDVVDGFMEEYDKEMALGKKRNANRPTPPAGYNGGAPASEMLSNLGLPEFDEPTYNPRNYKPEIAR